MRDDDDDAMRDDATATRSTTATTGRACARARDLADAARKGCRECYARLHRDEYGSPPWRRDDDAMRDDDEETYLGYSLRGVREALQTLLDATTMKDVERERDDDDAKARASIERETRRSFALWILEFMTEGEYEWKHISGRDFPSLEDGFRVLREIRYLIWKIGDVEILRAAANVRESHPGTGAPLGDGLRNLDMFDHSNFLIAYFHVPVEIYRFYHEEMPSLVPDLEDRKKCNVLATQGGLYRKNMSEWWCVVDYLLASGYEWPVETMAKLVHWHRKFDDTEKKALEDYKAAGCPYHPHVVREAAKQGSLDALKWLREKNAPFDKYAVSWAANSGQVETLKYLVQEIKVKPDPMMCARAAEAGELTALQTLHEAGVPWDKRCIIAAAKEKKSKKKRKREEWSSWNKLGRIRCLQFALAYGCPGAEDALALSDQISENTRIYLRQVVRCPGINHWFFRISRILGKTVQTKMPAAERTVLEVCTNELRLRQLNFESDAFAGIV